MMVRVSIISRDLEGKGRGFRRARVRFNKIFKMRYLWIEAAGIELFSVLWISKLQIPRAHKTHSRHKSHGRGTCQEREIYDILHLAGLFFDHDQNR